MAKKWIEYVDHQVLFNIGPILGPLGPRSGPIINSYHAYKINFDCLFWIPLPSSSEIMDYGWSDWSDWDPL